MQQPKHRYLTCCVNSTAHAIEDMMDQAVEIQCSTFKRRCDWQPTAEALGYGQHGLRLEDDYHIRYFRSRYRGKPAYVLVHSAIEYIFTVH